MRSVFADDGSEPGIVLILHVFGYTYHTHLITIALSTLVRGPLIRPLRPNIYRSRFYGFFGEHIRDTPDIWR